MNKKMKKHSSFKMIFIATMSAALILTASACNNNDGTTNVDINTNANNPASDGVNSDAGLNDPAVNDSAATDDTTTTE
ncbi:hypothetical protein [Paenibacillus sp. sgz302251]|uniref:hypothetical protein n=1 Tax=Paenibacillus sp. sgz302251 TaxID=3414493 RepID=UPI003C7B3FB0